MTAASPAQSALQADTPAEVALFVTRLAPALPVHTAELLRARLANSIALPAPGFMRERRLGLLRELVSSGAGEVPSVDDYERLRTRREAGGESWPSASNLLRAYGGWPAAVELALRLHTYGSPSRAPASYRHAPARRGYTHDEVVAGVIECRGALGLWPSPSAYYDWVRVRRLAARQAGLPEPRLASRTALERVCGSFARALALARRAADDESRDVDGTSADGTPGSESPSFTVVAPTGASEAERLADQLWLQVRDMDETERRLIFSALTRRLLGNSSLRVDHALDALRACIEATRRQEGLSRRVYDQWRDSHPYRHELPSSTYIRNTFKGSWSKALDVLGIAPTADVVARRSTNAGGRYTRAEMLAAIRLCARALASDDFAFARYRGWARQQLTANGTEQRLPLAPLTFIREFGSWNEAREAAGLADRRVSRIVRGSATDYREERIIEVLRLAAAESDGVARLTAARYSAWRRGQPLDKGVNDHGAVPAAATIASRFGSWRRALRRAGLAT